MGHDKHKGKDHKKDDDNVEYPKPDFSTQDGQVPPAPSPTPTPTPTPPKPIEA